MTPLRVGCRVVITRGDAKGQRGVITNSPGRVFNGWTVKLAGGGYRGVYGGALRCEADAA